MSSFATNFIAAFDNGLRVTRGETATYSPKAGGGPLSVRIVWDPVTDAESGKHIESQRIGRISPSDVALPVAGDTGVAAGGRSFRAVSVQTLPSGIHQITATFTPPA